MSELTVPASSTLAFNSALRYGRCDIGSGSRILAVCLVVYGACLASAGVEGMRQRWEIDELIESWTLDPVDRVLVGNKTGATRLGFAALLKFFEIEARSPRAIGEVPIEAIDFVGRQVDVRFGFRAWSLDEVEPATDALIEKCLSGGGSRGQALDALVVWCRRTRVEPSFPAAADRLIGSAVRRWEDQIHDHVVARLPDEVGLVLDAFVGEGGRGDLSWLRADPGPVGVDSVLDGERHISWGG